MNKYNRSLNRSLRVLTLGFCLFLAACASAKGFPPTPFASCLRRVETTRIDLPEAGSIFVPNQIILTGDPDHFVQILSNLDFSPFIEEKSIDSFEGFDIGGEATAINLYRLQNEALVLELIVEINKYAAEQGLRVVAEPNYLTDSPISGSRTDGGSGVVGSPGGAGALAQGQGLFLRQWAFVGGNGINLPSVDQAGATARDVRIVVFDTTPLEGGKYRIDWASKNFELCIWQPGLRFGESGAKVKYTPQGMGEIPYGEHGLFVAGIVQGITRDANYYLVEVLDNQARGDVYSLIRAMILFLRTAPDADLRTVYNLSLGIEATRNFTTLEAIDDKALKLALVSLIDNIEMNYQSNYTRDFAYLDELTSQFPVVSLKTAVEYLMQENVLVVAASGNDGGVTSQAPAAFSEVIGVASSNYEGKPSCFTNPGNVAAPSGDLFSVAKAACPTVPTPVNCLNAGQDCEDAVISIVAHGPSGTAYAYWTGTSFSTPIVSGLAALVLHAQPNMSIDDVHKVVRCSADGSMDTLPSPDANNKLGAGIIDVGRAMNTCLP